MADRVWNSTQNKWIYLPGEVNPGDILQKDEKDTTPMRWKNEAHYKDGRHRNNGHWAKNSTLEKKLNGSGKGGIMTEVHREGEMELYCKFFDGPIYLIPPAVIPCPTTSICKDYDPLKCYVRSNGRINVRNFYPGCAIYDPHRNPNNNFSCDVVIPNLMTMEAFGFEVHNENAIKKPKWLSGMPMLEFECHNEQQLSIIKRMKNIDLTDPQLLKICQSYNLGFLPCYRDGFPCDIKKIHQLMANEAVKHNDKQNNTQKSNKNQAPFSGYEPWDIWEWNYPYNKKGQLIEKVFRDKPILAKWAHNDSGYFRSLIILSRRARKRFNLLPTPEEIAMDEEFLRYLQNNHE